MLIFIKFDDWIGYMRGYAARNDRSDL